MLSRFWVYNMLISTMLLDVIKEKALAEMKVCTLFVA